MTRVSNHASFSLSACKSIEVILDNEDKSLQGEREGTYEEYQNVNGKRSWKSTANAIWYVPKFKSWAIGSLDGIGGDIRGIISSDETGDNNPYNVPYNEWWYYNKGWNKPDYIDDIIIQCVESKYVQSHKRIICPFTNYI